MTVLSDEVRKKYDAQRIATAQCQNYYFKGTDEFENGFDSAQVESGEYPEVLKAIFDSIGIEHAPEVDKAVMYGVAQYQTRHGGELPHPSIIAAALTAGLNGAKQITALPAEALSYYDSLNESGFDDVNHQHHESVSIVPAITVATIANVIAYATPIVAMIPNSNGSNEVPLVSIRFVTNRDFGAMKKSEYLDGANASKPYVEGRFRFALSNGGAGLTYSVTARTSYADYKAKTPDANAKLLPFLAGNVSIKINGKEVAHTRNRTKSKLTGKISAIAEKDIVINGVEYRVVGSEIDITASKISVTLNQALPAGAKVEVYLVADFDARDGNNNYLMIPVGVDFEPEYENLVASPIMAQVTLSTLLQSQVNNELKLGFLGQALAIVQGKIFLEQTVRLLGEAKDLAEYSKREVTFDASRGVTGKLAAAFNTTADLFGEVNKFISAAKLDINQRTGGSTVAYDLYVGDSGAVFFNQLSSDKMPTKTGYTAGYGQIVRIGTLADGTNVYHAPSAQELVAEADTAFDMLLIGRGNEPIRAPFVGFIQTPLSVIETRPDARESVLTLIGSQAAEMNPFERYADQGYVIHCINMPSLKNS
ncbi:hypothetical protein IIQ44_03805 [Acinetobacter oleivorans]|nr:hypothetical protein [Acinetobacter oleivorans]MBE2171028.1 hypothetical protein [Acinetobacter oleivorans]